MTNLVLIGFTSSGKSAVAAALAEKLDCDIIDLDQQIEALAAKEFGEHMSCREIYREYGEAKFRALESQAQLRVELGGRAPTVGTAFVQERHDC